ncbi:MAG: pyrroline-5-carboxylate reductase [Deltaproteobacteria bacterium]|jgi:pyrroline-5-carboxylate reductase|nr:pyrroline-5-carboxylate reductase [Deltaproteobacteria bacterium]
MKAKAVKSAEIGFLGYGRMAQAISQGLDRSGLVPYRRQAAFDVLSGKLDELAAERGFATAKNAKNLFDLTSTVILAVKPHQVEGALKEIAGAAKNSLIISIAAGVSLAALAAPLPPTVGLVRVIPNLPALVGQGMTLICAPKSAKEVHLEQAEKIFKAVGSVVVLDEKLFNEGTAVSGSGPAYFFLVMEAMIRGAVRLGLTWDMARELVLQTALGSAQAALANPQMSLAELRDQVTSPGGTTAEGLFELEDGAVVSLFFRALEAAAEKGRSLG